MIVQVIQEIVKENAVVRINLMLVMSVMVLVLLNLSAIVKVM